MPIHKVPSGAPTDHEELLASISSNIPGVVFQFYATFTGRWGMNYVSEKAEEILGISNHPAHFMDEVMTCLSAEDQELFVESTKAAIKEVKEWRFEAKFQRPDDREIFVRGISTPQETKGALIFHGILLDITEEHLAEERRRHSQKLDSLGQLAGGVAHDFNNMLGGIMGATELLIDRLEDDKQSKKLAQLILETSERAGELTWQLLAFSRKAAHLRQPQSVHDLIHRTRLLLERSIDQRISVRCNLQAEHQTVLGDPGQLQAALLNLGVNARDAMPDGGELIFDTQDVSLQSREQIGKHSPLEPGPYICVSVSDTGMGITPGVAARMFEPFFTTKPPGQGTGMGLSAAYGTIAEHKGSLALRETSTEGTCFEFYLPLCADNEVRAVEYESTPPPAKPKRVLLIEDEKIVRHTASRLLESLGYLVVEALDGRDGVELFSNEPASFDLVVLDMVMPRLSGEDTFHELRRLRADIPIVLCSGYSLDDSVSRLKRKGLAGHLTKPFRRKALKQALESALQP